MERPIKERLIGAGILVLAGVIVIPWLLGSNNRAPKSTVEQELILPGGEHSKNETRVITIGSAESTTAAQSSDLRSSIDFHQVKEIEIAANGESAPVATDQVKTNQAKTDQDDQELVADSSVDPSAGAAVGVAEVEKPTLSASRPQPMQNAPAAFDDILEDEQPKDFPQVSHRSLEKTPETEWTARESSTTVKAWAVQVGAFASQNNAERLARRLRGKNYAAFVTRNVVEGRVRFRVRVGPVSERAEADLLAAALREDRQPAKVLSHP